MVLSSAVLKENLPSGFFPLTFCSRGHCMILDYYKLHTDLVPPQCLLGKQVQCPLPWWFILHVLSAHAQWPSWMALPSFSLCRGPLSLGLSARPPPLYAPSEASVQSLIPVSLVLLVLCPPYPLVTLPAVTRYAAANPCSQKAPSLCHLPSWEHMGSLMPKTPGQRHGILNLEGMRRNYLVQPHSFSDGETEVQRR